MMTQTDRSHKNIMTDQSLDFRTPPTAAVTPQINTSLS